MVGGGNAASSCLRGGRRIKRMHFRVTDRRPHNEAHDAAGPLQGTGGRDSDNSQVRGFFRIVQGLRPELCPALNIQRYVLAHD